MTFHCRSLTFHCLSLLRMMLRHCLSSSFSAFDRGFAASEEDELDPRARSNYHMYVDAAYFILVTMSSVGYGDMLPITTDERMQTCVVIILGTFVWGESFRTTRSSKPQLLPALPLVLREVPVRLLLPVVMVLPPPPALLRAHCPYALATRLGHAPWPCRVLTRVGGAPSLHHRLFQHHTGHDGRGQGQVRDQDAFDGRAAEIPGGKALVRRGAG